MSLSDCARCWATPCECGYDYRNWTPERRARMAAIILNPPFPPDPPTEPVKLRPVPPERIKFFGVDPSK